MGLINIFNEIDNTSKTFHANGKIKDVLPELNFNNCLCLKAGDRIPSDYEITENDVIYIRKTPSEALSTAMIIAIVSASISVVAVGVGVGVGIYQYNKNKELQELLEKNTKVSTDVNRLPFLKGAKNQTSMGKTIPYVMGEMYHTPYLLNNGFYTISGDNGENQMWNAELISGYNDQRLKSVSIGTTKIADYDITSTFQDGIKPINDGIYQTANRDCKIEVSTSGELLLDGLNQKVVTQQYNEEVKHNYGEDAQPVVEQCAENVQRVQVCIRFEGLREFDSNSNNYKTRSVKIVPYWTNNPDDANPTWNEFTFDVYNDGSYSYDWVEMSSSEVETAIRNGYILKWKNSYRRQDGSRFEAWVYVSNSSEYRVTPINIETEQYKFEYHQRTTNVGNTIVRNTNKTCRFVATKTFTPAESYGKNISIKVVKVTPKKESGTNETCILDYIQTWCYDAQKSSSTELVPCRPIENPFRDNTLRIGLSMIANETTDNVLDEINIITTGCARTWNGSTWSSGKSPTRNPASWILEILTSDKHYKSKYLDSELNLASFGALYEYCETNEFYCDGIITEGKKKLDVIQSILSSVFADIILNDEGKLEVVIDKKETTPVALINSQNVTSIKYAKTFERKITGLKTTYVDHNSWSTATEYFMRDGRTTYDQEEDTLTELALDFVTTHNHAYKVAQRNQRQTVLQPRTITADVGLEGDYYPLYSTILLQMERFKQGIQSCTVHKLILDETGMISGLVLSDKIDFSSSENYGAIIQAQNNYGKKLIYEKITASGYTNRITFVQKLARETVSIEFGNIVSIGLLNEDGKFDKVTNVMKITGVKPSNNHGWELELKDYNEQIYEYGTIPEYKSNMTSRPTTERQTVEMKPVDYDGLKWETFGEIERVNNNLSERIDAIVTSGTVCYLDLLNFIIECDDTGVTQTKQTFKTKVYLRRDGTNIPFELGEIELPEGFSVSQDSNELTFTVDAGLSIKADNIKIPVLYTDVISSSPYVDENGNEYKNEFDEKYVQFEFAQDRTEWNLYLNYFGHGSSEKLGMFTSLDEIPETTNLSDYFVWGGTNNTASTLAKEGFFRQGAIYKFVGTEKTWSWEIDENEVHNIDSMSDIVGIANADLEHNNSVVWEYLDHLTANDIFTKKLVANSGFISDLSSEIVTTKKLVSSSDLGFEDDDDTTIIENGLIKTNKLDADAIKTKILTAENIQAVEGVFDSITVNKANLQNTLLRLSSRLVLELNAYYTQETTMFVFENFRKSIFEKYGEINSWVNGQSLWTCMITTNQDITIKSLPTSAMYIKCTENELLLQSDYTLAYNNKASFENAFKNTNFEIEYNKTNQTWHFWISQGYSVDLPSGYDEHDYSDYVIRIEFRY